MKKLLFIILFLPALACSQSIKVSPTPIALKSITTHSEIAFEYENIGIHFFYALYPNDDWFINPGKWDNVGYSKSTLGLSYVPINIFDIVSIGVIGTYHKFPVSKSTHLNFIVDIGINFNKYRLSLTHISNGFGVLHQVNPGFNSISFRYFF